MMVLDEVSRWLRGQKITKGIYKQKEPTPPQPPSEAITGRLGRDWASCFHCPPCPPTLGSLANSMALWLRQMTLLSSRLVSLLNATQLQGVQATGKRAALRGLVGGALRFLGLGNAQV